MAIYYVSPASGSPLGIDGDDDHTAAQAQVRTTPWATLQYAVDQMAAGDTVIALAGVYTISSSTECFLDLGAYGSPRSGTSGAYFTFKSENPAIYDIGGTNHAILDGQNLNYGGIRLFGSYANVDGFEIKRMYKAAYVGGFGISVDSQGPTFYTNNNITRNYIHHMGCFPIQTTQGAGSAIGGGGNYTVIDSNISHDIGRTGWAYVGDWSQGTVFDHHLYCQLKSGSRITNNLCYNTDTGPHRGAIFQIAAYHAGDTQDITIANNTLVGPGINGYSFPITFSYGVDINTDYHGSGINFYNNIFWKCSSLTGSFIDVSYFHLDDCLAYNNLTTLSGIVDGDVNSTWDFTSSGNILDYSTSDPMFVDEDNYDFHLAAGSGAINAAYTAGLPAHDLDGVNRPQSTNGEIGAYEYVSDIVRTYSRGSYGSLPSDDTDLTTIYSVQDYLDVALDDGTRVGESGNGYVLHQFKEVAGASDTKVDLHCNLQAPLAPSDYPVYLQCYDRVTAGGMWVTVVTDNTSDANTDFDMDFELNSGTTPTFANCKDGDGVISSRVYQTNVPLS